MGRWLVIAALLPATGAAIPAAADDREDCAQTALGVLPAGCDNLPQPEGDAPSDIVHSFFRIGYNSRWFLPLSGNRSV
jgi:hypothetical protein